MKCPFAKRAVLCRCLVAVAVLAAAPAVVAEQPAGNQAFPFDADRMLDLIFGRETTPAERAALAAIKISAAEEQQLGDDAAQAFIKQLRQQKIRVIARGKDVQYLRRLVALVHPRMTNRERYESISVYLALSDETDARSFPGGTLVFFRGLLEFVENEATMVAIVGHELAHLDHGHQLRHVRQLRLAQQSFQEPAQPQQFLSNGITLMRLFARPFRPEDEAQADRDGTRWAYELGYDPRELSRLFLRWHERGSDRPNLPAFFRTHPQHLDRREEVLELYADLQKTTPREELYVGRRNLQLRVTRDQSEFDE